MPAAQTSTPSEKQLKQQQLDAARVSNLKKQGWPEFGEQQEKSSALTNAETEYKNWQFFLGTPKAENITIKEDRVEIPVTIEVPFEQAVEITKKSVDAAQRRSDEDMSGILGLEQLFSQAEGLSATGRLSFADRAKAVEEAGRIFSEQRELRQEQSENLSNQRTGESEQSTFAEATVDQAADFDITDPEWEKQAPKLEKLIEDDHTRKPQQFRENVDLVRHHSDIDFPYLGGWLVSQAESGGKFLGQTVLNAKHWVDTKTALFDDLLFKQILGLGSEKPLTKEEQEKQKIQAVNKRSFFEALRSGAAKVLGSERRRNLRSRLEALNKSLKRGNLSYEGDLDENGQIRESVLLEEELANSQKTAEQLLAEKKKKLMMASPVKAKSGPGISMTADKAHNFNNAAKLAG